MIDWKQTPITPFPAFPRHEVPWCVFFDVDGTLLDIEAKPDEVRIDGELIALLRRLERTCDGAVALVSSRPISDIDRHFSPLKLPVAGVCGQERRDAGGTWHGARRRQKELIRVRELLMSISRTFRGLFLEDKGDVFAFHFRRVPHVEEVLRLRVAHAMTRCPDFEVREGEAFIEVKLPGPDKGAAIRAFMREPPFAGCTPICLGSDFTDQAAFAAIKRMNGLALVAGTQHEENDCLPRVADVRSWLSTLARQGDGEGA